MSKRNTDIVTHIRNNVEVNSSGCWIWQLCKFWDHYGQCTFLGKNRRVHRLTFELFVGASTEGKLVLHTCDVRACCNPDHLYLGDAKQNSADMVERNSAGMSLRGKTRKLSLEKARQIRALRADGLSTYKLAAMFDVSRRNIGFVLSGEYWPEPDSDINTNTMRKSTHERKPNGTGANLGIS
jgi:hypothetical protein